MYRPYGGNTAHVESKKTVISVITGATETNSISFIQYLSDALGNRDVQRPHWALLTYRHLPTSLHSNLGKNPINY